MAGITQATCHQTAAVNPAAARVAIVSPAELMIFAANGAVFLTWA
jgi:hypothetical protein